VPNREGVKGSPPAAEQRPMLRCAWCGYEFPANSIYAATWRGELYCCDGCLLQAFRDQPRTACSDSLPPKFARLHVMG
jgi:hypothetical protein